MSRFALCALAIQAMACVGSEVGLRACGDGMGACLELDVCASADAAAKAAALDAAAWKEAARALNGTVAELGAEVEALRAAHASAVREQQATGAKLTDMQARTASELEAQVAQAKAEVNALEVRLAASEAELLKLTSQLRARADSATLREAHLRRLQRHIDSAELALNATATAQLARALEAAYDSAVAGVSWAARSVPALARRAGQGEVVVRAARLWLALAAPSAHALFDERADAADARRADELGLGSVGGLFGRARAAPRGPSLHGAVGGALLGLLPARAADAAVRALDASAVAGDRALRRACAAAQPLVDSVPAPPAKAHAGLREASARAREALARARAFVREPPSRAALCAAAALALATAALGARLAWRLAATVPARLALRSWLIALALAHAVGAVLNGAGNGAARTVAADALGTSACASLAAALAPAALPAGGAPMPPLAIAALVAAALLLPAGRGGGRVAHAASAAATGSLACHAMALQLAGIPSASCATTSTACALSALAILAATRRR